MKPAWLLSAFLILVSAALLAQSNPVPLVYQSLRPVSAPPGHATFTLGVRGTGFVSGAVVQWNGQPLVTRFVSSSALAAIVPAALVSTPGTGSVTVTNPHGIASNIVYFPVRHRSSTVTLATDPATIESGMVVVCDFNRDNKPDISVFGEDNAGNAYLDTYFSNGTGNFLKIAGPQFQNSSIIGPGEVTGDFNNDGNLDVAVSIDGTYKIYLGNGRGGFTLAPGVVFGTGVVADVNGDGILDFVTMNFDQVFTLIVSLGNGDGTFTDNGQDVLVNGKISGVPVIGDFNGDGNLDVAIPGTSAVAVFLGKGDGTLQAEVDYPVSGGSSYGGSFAVAADINGDGKLDVVTNGASVLLGNGDGTFVNTFSMPVNSHAAGNLEIGDINGDGKLDLATTAIDFGTSQMMLDILLGNGDGTFQSPVTQVLGSGEVCCAPLGMADFNHDGRLDFAIGGLGSGLVLLQTPSK
ncbi:MAG: conserved repeat domain [Candidatus Sulfotelmatobacter sp.]|nr:conserved repeat domain [Candidatus Sulfotelmatobacter sp.]